MSKTSPASSAEAFAPEGARERKVFELGKTGKRWVLVFGVVLAVVLPASALLHDPFDTTVVCEKATRECTVVTRWLAREERASLSFDEIRAVNLSAERVSNDNEGRYERVETGRYFLSLVDHGGRVIDASLAADPDRLRRDALKALIFDGQGDRVEVRTRVSLSDSWAVIFLFLVGLFVIAMSRWRTVVEYEAGTRMVEVKVTRWPLLPRVALAARGEDIAWGDVKGKEFIFTVQAKTRDGELHHIARFGTDLRARGVASAINDFSRRAEKAVFDPRKG